MTMEAAVDALKTLMLTINPTPQPAPVAVWHYPKDTADGGIEIGQLPVVIVHRVTNRRQPLGTKAAGRGKDIWVALIDVLLVDGPLNNDEMFAEAYEKMEPWLIAVRALLFTNGSLLGTADVIGNDVQLGEYIDTHLQWYKRVFWGIRFEIPVKQTYPQRMTAQ